MREHKVIPQEIIDFRKKVGKNLRLMRESLNMTQNDLADDYNIPRIQIHRLENGKARYLDFAFLYKMSKDLDVLVKVFRENMPKVIYRYIHSKGIEKDE
jgi:transcriptional regulator with XRE-family HTH domain